MAENFASGKYSWFICDVCGWRYRYLEAKKSSYGTMQCPTCFDGQFDWKNHPQNKPPPVLPDPEALRDPRPDTNLNVEIIVDDMQVPLNPGGDNPA